MTTRFEIERRPGAKSRDVRSLQRLVRWVPVRYLEFLQNTDGAYVWGGAVAVQGVGMADLSLFLTCREVVDAADTYPDCLMIAEDDAGNPFCIRSDETVVFVDHETQELFPVAGSFESFLAAIEPRRDVPTVRPPDSAIVTITRPEFFAGMGAGHVGGPRKRKRKR